MNKLTLIEAVEQFGTPAQKRIVIENGKNLTANPMASLVKQLEGNFETVTIEGRGRNRIFILGPMKYEVVKRVDTYAAVGKHGNQIGNKGSKLPFSQDGKISYMVYEYLKTIGVDTMRYFTGLSLAQKALVITEREKQLADAMFNDDLYDTIVDTLIKEGHLPSRYHASILKDHVMRDTRPVKRYIETALKELKRYGLITYGTQPMVMVETDDEKKVIPISPENYKAFIDKEVELLNQYGLSRQDVTWKNKTEAVKKFNNAWKEEMKLIPYKTEIIKHVFDKDAIVIRKDIKTKGAYIPCEPYIKEYTGVIRMWEGFWVIVKASDKDIRKYVERYKDLDTDNVVSDLYNGRLGHIYDRAITRENDFIDNSAIEFNFSDMDFIDSDINLSILEEIQEQVYIPVKDMKRDKTYAAIALSLAKGLMKENRFEKIKVDDDIKLG